MEPGSENSMRKEETDALKGKDRENTEITRDELNLLTLRRWHYDHPEEYSDFLATFKNAYDGDRTFIEKNYSLFEELMSASGMNKVKSIMSSLFPRLKSDKMCLMEANVNPLNGQFMDMLDSSFNKEEVRQRLLDKNPYLFSVYYWIVFDDGFLHAADLMSHTFLKPDSPFWDRVIGRWAVGALISASLDKANYSKSQWKEISRKLKKGEYGEVIDSALEDIKGRHGRKRTCVLLEEMLVPDHVPVLTEEIESVVAEWKRFERSDTILPHIFAALVKGGLANGTYSYRTFHAAMREKFPQYNIGKGYDWAEAVYNAVVSDDGNCNTSITGEQIERGRRQMTEIKLRLLAAVCPAIS